VVSFARLDFAFDSQTPSFTDGSVFGQNTGGYHARTRKPSSPRATAVGAASQQAADASSDRSRTADQALSARRTCAE
jgi:hypothetical protein